MTEIPAPLPLDEARRIQALKRSAILDSLPEQAFDDIVALATRLCDAPIGLVSLVDNERQWFKACIGLPVSQTHRDLAFCAYAILEPDTLLVVEDATLDPRFSSNPLVLGEPFIRFYAGAPIITDDGHALGTVCVIDSQPRTLNQGQLDALQALARQTAALLQLRELSAQRDQEARQLSLQVIAALADDNTAHARLRQNQRIASIGQLTSGIAHDFNNLLQAISSSFQFVERKAQQPDVVKRWAQVGLQAVDKGAALISRLLAFSRETQPTLQALNICEQLASIEMMLGRVLGPDIVLEFDLARAPGTVLCDATQLESAVFNMLINARDAMQGRGRIRVSTRLVDTHESGGDGQYVELLVTDTGPGMPDTVREQVFQPFFTTKKLGEGTGLGLSQVYGFAIQTGGSASVSCGETSGTSVRLLLKVNDRADDARTHIKAEANAGAVTWQAKVLLVDDDEALREALAQLLMDVGYQVHAVGTGFAAVQALEHTRPDIVITDCLMRDLGGAVLAKVIKQIRPDLPVLFMSGAADRSALISETVRDELLVQKPVSLDSLLVKIEQQLPRHMSTGLRM
jgi:signal transduction histidine kinase